MFNIIGCLGVSVGTVDTIDQAMALVLKQIPIGKKKQASMRKALGSLAVGRRVHQDYGTSGVTVERL
ncbi:hypothetical protein DQT32_04465 [Salmonella enterica subsp. enterica serovar Braenderup]|nr:hypothetical protein [Salmonella enterica subsp. enterica serovar Braenderup]